MHQYCKILAKDISVLKRDETLLSVLFNTRPMNRVTVTVFSISNLFLKVKRRGETAEFESVKKFTVLSV